MSAELIPTERKSFSEVFPDIDKIEIVVKILNSGFNEVSEEIYSNTHFPAGGIKCGHSICKNGGLSAIVISSAIAKIYQKKKTNYSENILCNGGRYRGKQRYDSCGWSFKLLLKTKYKI